MRKLKLFLLISAICWVSATRVSAHDFEVDGIYYNITSSTDCTVAVTFKGDYYYSDDFDYQGSETIPESVTYNNTVYRVTSIGRSAFNRCYYLKNITIPESVTSIGEYAFDGCSGLTSITIPESVTEIKRCVFRSCKGLTSITIPESVTSIGEEAFINCTKVRLLS